LELATQQFSASAHNFWSHCLSTKL